MNDPKLIRHAIVPCCDDAFIDEYADGRVVVRPCERHIADPEWLKAEPILNAALAECDDAMPRARVYCARCAHKDRTALASIYSTTVGAALWSWDVPIRMTTAERKAVTARARA